MTTTLGQIPLGDPIAQHMREDFIRLHVGQSVQEALASARGQPTTGRVVYFYVLDDAGRLKGVAPTRRLLLSQPDQLITEVMQERVVTIPASATVLDACEFFTLHRLLAFPVVDDEGRMIGLVDVDLYMNEMLDLEGRESSDDMFQLIGVQISAAQQASPVRSFRRRFPWLLCNIAGGLMAALIADLNKDVSTLALVVPFIPVVLALSESVAIQSVSLAIQTLHGQRPTWTALVHKLRSELLTGLLLGAGCGGLVGIVAALWKRELLAAGSLLAGIFGGVAVAAVVGLTFPYLLRLLRRDPQVASGPIALAAVDMFSLFAYFSVARWFLR